MTPVTNYPLAAERLFRCWLVQARYRKMIATRTVTLPVCTFSHTSLNYTAPCSHFCLIFVLVCHVHSCRASVSPSCFHETLKTNLNHLKFLTPVLSYTLVAKGVETLNKKMIQHAALCLSLRRVACVS